MPVLLFTQTGDARPKVAKQFGTRRWWAESYFARIRFGEPGQPERGWLVECENADAGRELVAVFESQPRSSFMSNEHRGGAVVCASRPGAASGRILASGGKR